jgi:cobalt-precorrin-5B (C1)-methyltransferase
MHELERAEFDLQVLALNGLRRGRTTGSCATAAVKAALTWMLCSGREQQVDVTLPDGRHYLRVPIANLTDLDAATVRAEVLKDGGDDPDNTHGATIFAEVRRNALGTIRFFAGPGVGTATLPGLRVAVGEPAINPVPRKMMQQAVAEVLQDAGLPAGTGFDTRDLGHCRTDVDGVMGSLDRSVCARGAGGRCAERGVFTRQDRA